MLPVRLDSDSGQLSMNGRVPAGEYNFKVRVFDVKWKREVVSTVTITLKNIPEEAVLSSGSLRLQGLSNCFVQFFTKSTLNEQKMKLQSLLSLI